ncbi:hypothetical protein [Methylobacterium nonmethylotrophicum]|uniref:Capsule polysaccharide biosynthesis protein n=1 Tax=Methylobacterium nonmethylotrophicum TaxID=1141884 RepID=A0A4Z0NPV5_9HYPH|nr:hypothetical protein [Methylobacterium nonmethylotrophicum]TGD98934.1 hypothetical protein EU555_13555 [Methylobacterium nonmethylotrophicum]
MTLTPLIVCPTRTSIELALTLAGGMPHARFGLCTEYMPKKYKKPFRNAGNIHLYDNEGVAVSNLYRHSHVITFGYSEAEPHRLSKRLAEAAAQRSTPLIDIQHGLLQEGYTLDHDDYRPRIAPDQLCSWDQYGILIPQDNQQNRRIGNKIGVTSNLHWKRYSDQERILFIQSVREICRSFPEYLVFWRPHPGEYKYDEKIGSIFHSPHLVEKNLRILSFNDVDRSTITDFLSGMTVLFTAPSTTIVDAQRIDLPTIVFNAGPFDLTTIGVINTARTPDQVAKAISYAMASPSAFVPKLRMFKPFDFSSFEAYLNDSMSRQPLIQA